MALTATVLGSAPVSAIQPDMLTAGRDGWGTAKGEESARAVDDIRSAMAGRQLLEASRALGVHAAPLQSFEIPPAVVAELDTLAPAVRAPLLRLWAATHAADAMLGSTSGSRLRSLQRGLFNSDRTSSTTRLGSLPTTAPQREAAVATVFAALDEALSALSAAALPATGRSAESCDALDLRPQLCIGSEADNLHRDDAVLVLDLGGNDRYENGAGAAPFRWSDTAPRYGLLSVNIDLSGNDIYEGDTSPPAQIWGSAWTYGQGAGLLGGVGVLVDAAGDDVYRAAAQLRREPDTADGRTPWQGGLVAQGAGAAGEGWLVDLAGSDVYDSAIANDTALTGPASRQLRLAAQGGSAGSPACGGEDWTTGDPVDHRYGCSQGALLDLGGTQDSYSVRAHLPEDRGSGPDGDVWAFVNAQGAGSPAPSPGTLYDAGGDDAISLDVELPWDTGPGPEGPVGVRIYAQGAAHGSLITGMGDTKYSVEVRESGVSGDGVTEVFVQAASGLLDDAGGNDVYGVEVLRSAQEHLAVGDGPCDAGPGCVAGRPAVVDATGRTPRVLAQGVALNDHGILRDRSGDDHYAAVGVTTMDVAVTQSSSQAAPPLYVKAFPDTQLHAQGDGYSSSPFVAELRDDGGTDVYEARTSNNLRIDGSTGDGSQMVAFMQGAAGRVQGQGSGNGGSLADLGGVGDRFVMSADRDITGPPGLTKYFALLRVPRGQGQSKGAFVALGERPVVQTRPAAVACGGNPGYRGYGVWTSGEPGTCAAVAPDDEAYHIQNGSSGGLGFAPGAQLAQPASLDVRTESPGPFVAEIVVDDSLLQPAPPQVGVSATLTNASGAPLADRVVHFTLQNQVIGPTDGSVPNRKWDDRWTVDAVTDGTGRAVGMLPLQLPKLYLALRNLEDFRWQVLASSDGEPGALYPARSAAPVSVVHGDD